MADRGGLRLPRTMSLAVQLLLTFVVLVAVTTVVLGIAGYKSSLDSLNADAVRAVSVAAQLRDDMMTRMFTSRLARSEGFLAGLESLCGERREDGFFGFELECAGRMAQEFRTTEGAAGVEVLYLGRVLATAGTTSGAVYQPGAIASIVRRSDGGTDFSVKATRGALLVTVQFDSAEINELFARSPSLGDRGEVTLTDGNRRPITPLEAAPSAFIPDGLVGIEPLGDCRKAQEVIDYDYRGVMSIHSIRRATVLDQGCIDAHISQTEALSPGEDLGDQLVLRGGVFILIGAVLSVLAARRIAAPVTRLVEAAHRIETGRFSDPVPLGGPSEIRALGAAFAAMAKEIEKLIQEEQSARRDAESANRSKDHFLATLSHELRTPLNAILGWSRLLRSGSYDTDAVERATLAIDRSAESLRRLVDDLFDVSRIVSGRLRMELQPINLATTVEAAIDSVRPQALERGVRLDTHIPPCEIVVVGDGQRLQQVVWNLLWNAIKFTPEGGTVELSLAQEDDRAELAVVDTGAGIAADSLPQIFGWFQQAEAGSQSVDAGLGVGLALVKQIVELHGGAVTAESAGLGTGATFRVRLPLAPSEARLQQG